MNFLALDIGGANLKMADGKGFADFRPFALWSKSGQLQQELRTLIAEAPTCDHLVVTMTGELADCFQNKEEGVRFILKAVKQASDGRHTRVYLCDGKMVTPEIAAEKWTLASASNWHALARWSGRYAKKGTALLFDIGSTTCDLVPLEDGVPRPAGLADTERLLAGELVYAGVERTPVCSVVDTIPYRGAECPATRELFATTADVYVLLGDLPEDPANHNTADARPLTKAFSRSRLGRMISAEGDQFNHRDAAIMAEAIARAQIEKIGQGLKRVAQRIGREFDTVILSGHGEFLARRVLDSAGVMPTQVVSLNLELGPLISRCAPAHALAVLAREAAGL